MYKQKAIVITGASSGIGESLAINYAKILNSEYILILLGRSNKRLKLVLNTCLKYHSSVEFCTFDLNDEIKLKKNIKNISDNYVISSVICSAGATQASIGLDQNLSIHNELLKINYLSVINLINEILPSMKSKSSASIAIISSIAGLLPLPNSYPYSVSKAALIFYAEYLRLTLKNHNIKVHTILPGFVKTPMTDKNNFNMPFMVSSEIAAQKIINGIKKGKEIIAFPYFFYLFLKFISIIPQSIRIFILRAFFKY